MFPIAVPLEYIMITSNFVIHLPICHLVCLLFIHMCERSMCIHRFTHRLFMFTLTHVMAWCILVCYGSLCFMFMIYWLPLSYQWGGVVGKARSPESMRSATVSATSFGKARPTANFTMLFKSWLPAFMCIATCTVANTTSGL